MQKNKIVNILLSDKNGGVEQSFVNYCLMLQQNNCDILAIIKKDAQFIPDLQKNNINFIEIDNKFGYYDIFSILKIRNIIKNYQANIAIAHVGKAIILSKKALMFNNIKLIAVNHSNNIKRSLKADIIFAVNNDIITKIQQNSSHNNHYLMPNSIDISDNKFLESNLAISKKKQLVIGSMGRLSGEKNFDKLLQSIKFLKDHNYNIALKIAGTGDELPKLQKLAKDLNITENVEFLGWVDQESFFNKIDIFILLSKEETFGMVFLEAAKYQKLIIATNTDGANMILKNKENALIIDQNSNRSISMQILEYLEFLERNPEEISKIVKNSWLNLQKNYSNDMIAKKMLQIIPKFILK